MRTVELPLKMKQWVTFYFIAIGKRGLLLG